MTFKSDWEVFAPPLQETDLEAFVAHALENHSWETFEVLKGGQANLNLKVTLAAGEPLLLRLYWRDAKAALKELHLYEVLKESWPVAKILKVGRWQKYAYAMVEWMPGRALRDLLLEKRSEVWHDVMLDLGQRLAGLRNFSFDKPGFFNEMLRVETAVGQQELLDYGLTCLEHPTVVQVCSEKLLVMVRYCFLKFVHLVPEDQAHLVHGDFDPSNILVREVSGQWQVSAVLDWEFAFSGSMLWDVANMLRYAHQMESDYEQAFIKGLERAYLLPDHWRQTVALMNISSVLDLLTRTQLTSRKRVADLVELLQYHSRFLTQDVSLKTLRIYPYNENWPLHFHMASDLLQQALGDALLKVHHIGSTAVPGLNAKPDIDVVCVVDDLKNSLVLQDHGFDYKGELNIPLRYYFSRNTPELRVNCHVVEKDHGFIDLNLCFRDYLRTHPQARDDYGQLKWDLFNQAGSYEKRPNDFSNYNYSKNAFIKKTLKSAGFQGITYNFCFHEPEWQAFETLISQPRPSEEGVAMVMSKSLEFIGAALIQRLDSGVAYTLVMKEGAESEQGTFETFLQKWISMKTVV